MSYTTIFFDLDDTLIDTLSNSKTCLEEVYTDLPIVQDYYSSFEAFHAAFFTNSATIWKKYNLGLISKEELIEERFAALFRPFRDVSIAMVDTINTHFLERIVLTNTLMEGALDLLHYLQPKYSMHILSNGFSELQYKKMDNAGLTPYFDMIILSDAVGINKPEKGIFEHALRLANASPKEALMIGDNVLVDIIGAANTGIDQVWYNSNNNPSEGIIPSHTVQSLLAIKELL